MFKSLVIKGSYETEHIKREMMRSSIICTHISKKISREQFFPKIFNAKISRRCSE